MDFKIEPETTGWRVTSRETGWGLGVDFPSQEAAERVVSIIRAELGVETPAPMRYALVNARDASDTERIAAYLPANYKVLGRTAIQATAQVYILIGGSDVAGWTLDDYVIPRLASGLIFAEEIA